MKSVTAHSIQASQMSEKALETSRLPPMALAGRWGQELECGLNRGMLFQIEAQALVSYLLTSPNAHLHFYVFCSPTESLPSNSSWRAVQFYSSDCCLMTPDNKALFLEMSATWQPGRELLLSGMNQLSRSKELQARACQPISSKQPLPALHLRSERAHLSE